MAKSDLYANMRDEFFQEGHGYEEIPSIQTFLHVWRTKFPELKIPWHNTLGVCGTCLQLKTDIRSLSRGAPERQNLRSTLNEHMNQVREERHDQVIRDQNSTKYPLECWAITTDYMQDLYMPYLAIRPKNWYVNV